MGQRPGYRQSPSCGMVYSRMSSNLVWSYQHAEKLIWVLSKGKSCTLNALFLFLDYIFVQDKSSALCTSSQDTPPYSHSLESYWSFHIHIMTFTFSRSFFFSMGPPCSEWWFFTFKCSIFTSQRNVALMPLGYFRTKQFFSYIIYFLKNSLPRTPICLPAIMLINILTY